MDRSRDLDHQAADADDAAVDLDLIKLGDLVGKRFHDSSSIRMVIGIPLTGHLPVSLMIASPSLGLGRLACQDGGASRKSRLASTLNVEHEGVCGEKACSLQHITAIRWFPHSKCLHSRIRFC